MAHKRKFIDQDEKKQIIHVNITLQEFIEEEDEFDTWDIYGTPEGMIRRSVPIDSDEDDDFDYHTSSEDDHIPDVSVSPRTKNKKPKSEHINHIYDDLENFRIPPAYQIPNTPLVSNINSPKNNTNKSSTSILSLMQSLNINQTL